MEVGECGFELNLVGSRWKPGRHWADVYPVEKIGGT